MRGWLHTAMFPLSLAGGIVLVALARLAAAAACSVYALSACLLLGTSGVYHCGTWGPRAEAVLRRLDHANIFLITAGTYTPLAVLVPAGRRLVLLSLVWGGAAAGIAFRVWWIKAPRWLYTVCYLALGWAAVFYLPAFARTGGIAVIALIIVGGLLYTTGAVVYALKRPDPSPRWFGFHEVFHALTIAALTLPLRGHLPRHNMTSGTSALAPAGEPPGCARTGPDPATTSLLAAGAGAVALRRRDRGKGGRLEATGRAGRT